MTGSSKAGSSVTGSSSTGSAPAGSLTAVREIWAERDQARTRGDLLYLIYVALLSFAVLVVPVLRALGAGLARPDVLPALLADAAPQTAGAALPLASAVLVLVGAVRGPALLAPFFTATLASSALPRRVVLWRPFVRAALVPVLVSVTVVALITVALASSGHAEAAEGAWFVVAGLGAGLLLGAAWLLGQLLDVGPRRGVALTLALAAAGMAWSPAPVLLGAVYPVTDGATSAAWAVALLVAGSAAVGGCVPLLDRLRATVLAEQASRWESASLIATSGDLAGAGGTFRARPSTGRRLPAIGTGPLPLLYARRDVIAWLRTPERTVVGALSAAAGAAMLAAGVELTGPLAWMAAAAGTLGLWAASSAYVDGMRHAINTLGAPPLLCQSAGTQAVLHALAPTLLLAALALAGAGAEVVRTGASAQDPVSMLLIPVALVPVLVAGRGRDAAKGAMPLQLATPMPTAQGDLSVFPMLAWHADAILLALGAGILLTALAGAGAIWVLFAAVVVTAVMTAMARSRLWQMRR